jgi:hypothetical protein
MKRSIRGFAGSAGVVALFAVAASTRAAEIDPDADAILRGMCQALAAQNAFTVASDASSEVILRDGRKVQLAASGTATVDRARGFRFDRRGPFGATAAAYDGETLTIWAEALGGYASVPAPGGLDAGLDALLAVFGSEAAGGADLLYADPCGNLMNDVEQGEHLGETFVGGQRVDHLFYRAAELDWQLWISVDAPHLPVRYVITSKWLAGAPQFSAQFTGWGPAGRTDFAFTPPEGARALDPAEARAAEHGHWEGRP